MEIGDVIVEHECLIVTFQATSTPYHEHLRSQNNGSSCSHVCFLAMISSYVHLASVRRGDEGRLLWFVSIVTTLNLH